jgi:pyridoxine/pyridoxamine 5'-phosphate oxidase
VANGARTSGGVDGYVLAATVRPEGRPHVRPILAVWVEGRLYFCAGEITRKAKNLALEAQCAVTVEWEPLDLVVEGIAEKVNELDCE